MEVKSSFVRKKYCLNCLLVTKDTTLANNATRIVEDLGLNVKAIASSVGEFAQAITKYSLDLILSEENINTDNKILDAYATLDNQLPLILISDLDSTTIEEKEIKAPVKIVRKPLKDDSLKNAVNCVLKDHIDSLKENGDIKRVDEILYLRVSGKVISTQLDQVTYIKAEGNYCTVHVGEKRFVIRSSISNVLSKLETSNFIQIHRGYIVNIQSASKVFVKKGYLHMADLQLPVGRKYKKDLINHLKEIPTI